MRACQSAVLYTTLVLGLGLLACSGSGNTTTTDTDTDTNTIINNEEGPAPSIEEAQKALNEALRAYNPYCLGPRAENSADFPITLINPSARSPTHQYQQLWVLKEIGLLDTTATESTGGLPVHEFSITRQGERTRYDIAQSGGYRRMFCYGVPSVTRIDSIKALYNAGPNDLAKVWFTSRVEKRRSWSDSVAVRNTFPGVTPLPPPKAQHSWEELLVQVDSAWVDRRLTGYGRPPNGPADSVQVR